jgi:hypothetical protein
MKASTTEPRPDVKTFVPAGYSVPDRPRTPTKRVTVRAALWGPEGTTEG